jgi:DNA-binding MarR family transcriptional regulator
MPQIPDANEMAEIAEQRQQHIGRLLQRAYRAFTEQATALLQARGHQGLSLAHTTFLAYIDEEGTHITALAERAGMTKQAMGQMIAELERHGYISRNPDPADRRATLVRFTATGWQFLRDAAEVKRTIDSEYVAVLGAERFAALRQSLVLLVDHHAQAARPTS